MKGLAGIVLVSAGIVNAWSPTGGYAPGNVSCPSVSTVGNDSLVREAVGLSDGEVQWLKKRHEHTDEALKEFLTNADLDGFDVDEFMDSLNRSINIALAFSGGGYRAMLCGAGEISALDNRTEGANEHGLGGLLQASTYLAGLSGGNWLTGSLALNNWTSVQDIIDGDTIWDLDKSIFSPGGWNIFKTASRWDDISDEIHAKKKAGFNTSLTDIWGRSLSYQFFGSDENAMAGLTFTTLRDVDVFANGEMPFPISVADGRAPNTTIISANSTIFEFNPFEMGSWDHSLRSFTDLKYMGSDVSNGVPVDSDVCVAGYDNAGFVMGTSSTLFNQFLLQLNTTGLSGFVYDMIRDFLEDVSSDKDDIAIYAPNPFKDTDFAAVKSIINSEYLFLVDGGEDSQNIPLAPLINPNRDVDVIFAFDNSADTKDNLPDGGALVATYERQFVSAWGNHSAFPYVPDKQTFIENNLTTRPTFFGCDASNLTHLADIPPLIVYTANTPYTFWSNTSTFKMSYDEEEKLGMIQNGFEVASRFNLTMDEDWPKCVACAIIRRSQERANETQSDECKKCFSNYCWDGSYVSTDSKVTYSHNVTSPKDDAEAPNSSGEVTKTTGAATAAAAGSTGSQSSASATSSSSSSHPKKNAALAVAPNHIMKYVATALVVGSIALVM